MKFTYNFVLVIITGIVFGACGEQGIPYIKTEPAKVVAIADSKLSTLQLTEKAIERIGIKTTQVTDGEMNQNNNKKELTVPYSSVLYDAGGGTWVYTNPEPGNYVRHEVEIDRIAKDNVFLSKGPSSGTRVVIQGAAELLGTEFHVGH